jgi:hypothetical protein
MTSSSCKREAAARRVDGDVRRRAGVRGRRG